MVLNNSYPRLLIFSQTFNRFSGGGITLTNLFSGWPKDRIAVISYDFMLKGVSNEICDTYYQLGQEEIHWKFPFSLIKPKNKSGLINVTSPSPVRANNSGLKIRQKIVARVVNQLINWLGLEHLLSSISISEQLNSWVSEYNPELLYFQISNRESISFAQNLIDRLRLPSVIHMMDDWPTIIADGSIFKQFWQKKIGSELQQLFDQIDLHLSICDEMSAEYRKRYGHEFLAFHNTIDLSSWAQFTRRNLHLNEGTKTVLFSGRIGKGIEKSLLEVAEAVERLRSEGMNICLQVQSPRNEPDILEQLSRYESVTINPPVEYNKLPELYSQADILVIANDFTRDGIRFLKYSMPTKAPEYMISGTPVLVYASSETALYKVFNDNNCGSCVEHRSTSELVKALRNILDDKIYRELISRNAVAYAVENFDSKKVRKHFQDLIIETGFKR